MSAMTLYRGWTLGQVWRSARRVEGRWERATNRAWGLAVSPWVAWTLGARPGWVRRNLGDAVRDWWERIT